MSITIPCVRHTPKYFEMFKCKTFYNLSNALGFANLGMWWY